jgi:hypothetical protein
VKAPSTSTPPSSPAEIFAPPPPREGLAWRMFSLFPFAAAGFALLAWIATAFLAYDSESKGIAGATVAMFPTGFGIGGMLARSQEAAAASPRMGRVFGVAVASGAGLLVVFFLFMASIWPAL